MNKTININLGGIFFHIDEIAYQKLKLYLDAIRRSLSDDPQGRDEIISDIELRIGELLSERIKDARQVVNENDIDEITKIMGKPEDYLVDEEMFDDEPKFRKRKSSKKLYRDVNDKFLGGVSSGIAHYVGIDVIWVRILWIILVVGGFGAGILVYVLLWILVPEAQTTTEKLQMEGEQVNISNIEKKIREELTDVAERVKDGVNDVTEKVKNSKLGRKSGKKAKSGLQDLIDAMIVFLVTLFKITAKFIGVILVFVSSITIISLIIAAFSWGSVNILGIGEEYIHIPQFLFDSIMPMWLLILFVFLVSAIPFILLFMLGLRIISNNVKSFGITANLTLLGIWIIALLGIVFAGIDFSTRTAFNGVHNQTEELSIVANDTISVKMVSNQKISNSDLERTYGYEVVHINDIERLFSSRINLDIRKTEKETAFIKIKKKSEGRSKSEANNDAKAVEYQFKLNNKNLLLDGYFLSEIENNYKDQLVDITIYLPVDTVIYLDASTRTFLLNVRSFQDSHDSEDMPKHYFQMTEDGLKCLDCEEEIIDVEITEEQNNI